MSVSLGANGGSYDYPQENDPAGWGDDATNWASAVSAALGNIGLGGTLNAKALLDLTSSTTKGFLPPKLTTTQRDAIATPPTGLVLYNTTKNQLEVYTGSAWASVSSVINDSLTVNGATTLNGTLTVTGSTALQSVTSTGSTVNGALTVTGSTSLQSVTSTGETVNGVLSVTGNTTLVNVTGANVTSTGTILAASGSSGSPSVASSGDTDTGIYWSAANELTFSTGGNPRFRIESTGQIKAVYESQVGTDYNTTLHNGYFCRAWVNFNGTGTVAIRTSGNVSSITDNGTGDYTVNFTTAMPDADYVLCGASTYRGVVVTSNLNTTSGGVSPATGSCRINSSTAATDFDSPLIMVAFFR